MTNNILAIILTLILASCSAEDIGDNACNDQMDRDIARFGDGFDDDSVSNEFSTVVTRYWWELGQGVEYMWSDDSDNCQFTRFDFTPVLLD